MAKPTATAASTALPPLRKTSIPTRAASASCATTTPFVATTFWARPICSSPRAATDSANAPMIRNVKSKTSLRRRLRIAPVARVLSQHRRQDAVRRPMAVHERVDVEDDLLAHIDTALERRRAEMRQQHDFSGPRELDQFWAHSRLVLENVEA